MLYLNLILLVLLRTVVFVAIVVACVACVVDVRFVAEARRRGVVYEGERAGQREAEHRDQEQLGRALLVRLRVRARGLREQRGGRERGSHLLGQRHEPPQDRRAQLPPVQRVQVARWVRRDCFHSLFPIFTSLHLFPFPFPLFSLVPSVCAYSYILQ